MTEYNLNYPDNIGAQQEHASKVHGASPDSRACNSACSSAQQHHVGRHEHTSQAFFRYERLPHSHCEYPGCDRAQQLSDIDINDADVSDMLHVTPWSNAQYNSSNASVTLCRHHQRRFYSGDFHVVRSSDDSLTFMPTRVAPRHFVGAG